MALGPLRILVSNAKWLKACETTHRFADYYVDKALQYRQEFIAGMTKSSQGDFRQRHLLLYRMAEQTDDKIDLRNQTL